MSTLSRANPPEGTRRACMVSVNTAGSREEAPYTALVDLSTNRRTDDARWLAASSCMMPMTLSSFIGTRPPEPAGVELMFMCTTVSTDADPMTLPISGLRMSARTNSVRPSLRSIAGDGGAVSTPMTRSREESAASSAASAPPSHRLTPVTRTTAGGTSVSSLLVATLNARLLQQLAVLLLRHPLAPLLDDRPHECSRRREISARTRQPGSSPGVARRPSVPAAPRRRCRGAALNGPEPKNLRRTTSLAFAGSGDVGVRVAQVVLHGPLGDAEGTADADGGELAGVDEAVHGHLGNAHHRGDLGHGQERDGLTGLGDGGAADGHGGGVRGRHGSGHGGGHRATDRTGAGNTRTTEGGGCGTLGHGHVFVSGTSSCRGAGFPTGN